MKDLIKILGLVVISTVIGFSFAACGGGDEDEDGLIDSELIGQWAAATGTASYSGDSVTFTKDKVSGTGSINALLQVMNTAAAATKADIVAENGNIYYETGSNKFTYFKYTISSDTLTLKNALTSDATVVFVGSKK